MKNIFITTVTVLIATIGMNANTIKTNYNEQPFVFVESGIEIALFKDGQFDFNVLRPNVGVQINTRLLDFSFNGGHNYDTYVQYDDFGAVIQIENTTIDYDYFGRVSRIGNLFMDYNYGGLVSRIGNMNIGYTSYGDVSYVNGIIDVYNTNYVTNRPHYRVYKRPIATRVVIHSTPYRRNYVPVRCEYVSHRRNYATNRRSVGVSRNFKRPGTVVVRNNRYAASKRSNKQNTKGVKQKTNANKKYISRSDYTKNSNRVAANTGRINNNRVATNTSRTSNNNRATTSTNRNSRAATNTKNTKKIVDNSTYKRR